MASFPPWLTSRAHWHKDAAFLGFGTFESIYTFITEPLQSLAWAEFNTNYYIPSRYRATPARIPSAFEATTFAYIALRQETETLTELRVVPNGKENWRDVHHYARFIVQLVVAHGDLGGLWSATGLMERCEVAFGVLLVFIDSNYRAFEAKSIRVNNGKEDEEESEATLRRGISKQVAEEAERMRGRARQRNRENLLLRLEAEMVRGLDEEVVQMPLGQMQVEVEEPDPEDMEPEPVGTLEDVRFDEQIERGTYLAEIVAELQQHDEGERVARMEQLRELQREMGFRENGASN